MAALFDCMMKEIPRVTGKDYAHWEAEQGWLRYFFGDTATTLPKEYNTQKTSITWTPTLWNESRVIMLHYTGAKPQKTWSPVDFLKTFRDDDTRRTLKLSDQIDDEVEEYRPLLLKWRRVYFSSVHFEKRLSLFCMYHDEKSHAAIKKLRDAEAHDPNVLVPLSLVSTSWDPNGLTTVKERPQLASRALQLQLGENAGLLAIASARWYEKPWVGFTTYSEPTKATWREGASLDWTRVQATMAEHDASHARIVLFWYGMFAGNYSALLEAHHPGMHSVMKEIFGDMQRDTSLEFVIDLGRLSRMPKNRVWPFANYVILPTRLLREYVQWADAFVAAYQRRYSARNDCPFGTQETVTPNWQARCVGYMLERLMHWWSVLADVTLVHAVDDPHVRYQAGCAASKLHCRDANYCWFKLKAKCGDPRLPRNQWLRDDHFGGQLHGDATMASCAARGWANYCGMEKSKVVYRLGKERL